MEVINAQDGTNHRDPQEKKGSTIKTWIIVLSIALFFFLWGIFIFSTVGPGRPPAWDYGVVPDVPGQSVYSVQTAEDRAGTANSGGETPPKQHIMGQREETGKPQGKKGL
jgi:hypothetical protein